VWYRQVLFGRTEIFNKEWEGEPLGIMAIGFKVGCWDTERKVKNREGNGVSEVILFEGVDCGR